MRLINFVPEVFSLFVEVVMAAVVVSRRAFNERKIKPSRKMIPQLCRLGTETL